MTDNPKCLTCGGSKFIERHEDESGPYVERHKYTRVPCPTCAGDKGEGDSYPPCPECGCEQTCQEPSEVGNGYWCERCLHVWDPSRPGGVHCRDGAEDCPYRLDNGRCGTDYGKRMTIVCEYDCQWLTELRAENAALTRALEDERAKVEAIKKYCIAPPRAKFNERIEMTDYILKVIYGEIQVALTPDDGGGTDRTCGNCGHLRMYDEGCDDHPGACGFCPVWDHVRADESQQTAGPDETPCDHWTPCEEGSDG